MERNNIIDWAICYIVITDLTSGHFELKAWSLGFRTSLVESFVGLIDKIIKTPKQT